MALAISVIATLIYFPQQTYANDSQITYSGSTTASYGYKPDCTFTIDKIVDNKFRGSFSATNLGAYNVSQKVQTKNATLY